MNLDAAQLDGKRILIRAPNWIGDAVMCLPAMYELRRALPNAEVTIVGRPWVLDVFPAQQLRCGTIPYDTRGPQRGLLGRMRFAASLRKRGFAAAILFQNAFDAALVAFLAAIPMRAGYSRDARRLLLTHPVAVPRPSEIPAHETYYYLEMLRRLGLMEQLPALESIALPVGRAERETARQRIFELLPTDNHVALRAPIVGFGAGASFGTAKRWAPERFGELSVRLQNELGAASVFFGSGDERALVETILPSAGRAAISLAGKTSLPEFMRLVRGCDLYITNDTGTMHVAAALGVPTLAIFGPTDENGTRPLGPETHIITGTADCRPCKLRHCPIDHRCMTSVSVEMVVQAAAEALRRSKNGPVPSPLELLQGERGLK